MTVKQNRTPMWSRCMSATCDANWAGNALKPVAARGTCLAACRHERVDCPLSVVTAGADAAGGRRAAGPVRPALAGSQPAPVHGPAAATAGAKSVVFPDSG